jgi:hypothetical protein
MKLLPIHLRFTWPTLGKKHHLFLLLYIMDLFVEITLKIEMDKNFKSPKMNSQKWNTMSCIFGTSLLLQNKVFLIM